MKYEVTKTIKYCPSSGPGNRITHMFEVGTIIDSEDGVQCPEELEKTFAEGGYLVETKKVASAPAVEAKSDTEETDGREAVWTRDLDEEKETINEKSKLKSTRKEKTAKKKKTKRAK